MIPDTLDIHFFQFSVGKVVSLFIVALSCLVDLSQLLSSGRYVTGYPVSSALVPELSFSMASLPRVPSWCIVSSVPCKPMNSSPSSCCDCLPPSITTLLVLFLIVSSACARLLITAPVTDLEPAEEPVLHRFPLATCLGIAPLRCVEFRGKISAATCALAVCPARPAVLTLLRRSAAIRSTSLHLGHYSLEGLFLLSVCCTSRLTPGGVSFPFHGFGPFSTPLSRVG